MKTKLGTDDRDAKTALIEVLIPLWRINPVMQNQQTEQVFMDSQIYVRALDIFTSHGVRNYYDCVVAVNAMDAGCATLYTEDRHLLRVQRIEDMDIVNPFT